MKKILYLLSVVIICVAFMPIYGGAEDYGLVKIPLLYPQKSTAERKTSGICNKTIMVSGIILVELEDIPYLPDSDPERYLVEYYIDDTLFYKTNGINKNNPGILNFNLHLDTKSIKNGEYRLIVNFWDKKGKSAIGIKRIKISNQNE